MNDVAKSLNQVTTNIASAEDVALEKLSEELEENLGKGGASKMKARRRRRD